MVRTIRRTEEITDGSKVIITHYKVEQYYCEITREKWVDMHKEITSQYTIKRR